MFAEPPKPPAPDFGLYLDKPKEKAGVCTTADVQRLASQCGVVDENGSPLTVSSLPFTGFARDNGQKWHLRIEPLAAHQVGANFVTGHHWVFSLAAGGDDQMR